MREETVKLSYGCLLHDIGKAVQRAGGKKGDHSEIGHAYMKDIWAGESEVLRCIKFHHSDALRASPPARDSLAWICYLADNIAAAADRRETGSGEKGFSRYLPLAPVFSHMNGEHTGYSIPAYPQDGMLRMPENTRDMLAAVQYQQAVEQLAPKLKDLDSSEAWLDSLLCLLESYLSPFPASTNTNESPDVSLFDHLKITAAVGACICEYLHEQGERDFRKRLFDHEKDFMDEKAFLLYSADLSGIQSFIYTVSSDKALRSLRSRSFFLDLLMEHYADELLALCGLSRAELLYIGGGHCYILLPNTLLVKEKLNSWNKRFDRWLTERFGASLFLAHGYTECSANELTDRPAESSPYRQMFQRVSFAVARHKLQRYDAEDIRLLNRSSSGGERECKICGRSDELVDDRCQWCKLFVDLSEKIQSCPLYYVSSEAKGDVDLVLPRPEGKAYLSFTDEKTARSRVDGDEAVIRIYSKNTAYTGLRYSTRLYVGDYAYSNSMEELAKSSSGIARLGICRMDVDDLGKAFVSGFCKEGSDSVEERERYLTISRTAAFSRQISLFFKCYINSILSGEYGRQAKLAVTVVYSGGDDVFLLGAWNDTIEAAKRIQQCFTQFCCGALSISAGISIVPPSYPVRLSADACGKLVDVAKGNGKNSICIFDDRQCYSWQRFIGKIWDEKRAALKAFFDAPEQDRGMAYLYRTVQLLRSAQGKEGKLQLARYAYMLARLEPPKNSPAYAKYKVFSGQMYGWAMDERARAELITAIYIYVYENREVDINGR